MGDLEGYWQLAFSYLLPLIVSVNLKKNLLFRKTPFSFKIDFLRNNRVWMIR